ncbi:MAG TPA: phosphoglycerate dehydrogenase, partial [Clostridiaceae bacterium]|nr:phosphoglycerate dehydrogenase [Clostridiaceae bacterium]
EPKYDLKEGEIQDYKNDLLNVDNLVITPHLGASTREAQENVGISVAKEVIEALNGSMVENAINLPSIGKGEFEVIRPFMILAEKLGKIYYQISRKHVN